MSYRNDLAALSARKSALETEVRDRQRELADASRLVEEIEARRKLPVLDNIRVAAPCPAKWADMTGDDRVRACAQCDKSVYNLSDMTREEAQALLIEKEGRLCVRYFQRTDGTILLKDCVVGVRRRRRLKIVAIGAAAGLAAGLFAYEKSSETLGGMESPVMGQVMVYAPEPVPQRPTPTPTPPEDDRIIEVAGAIAPPPPVETKTRYAQPDKTQHHFAKPPKGANR